MQNKDEVEDKMMDKEKKERDDLKMEIEARKEVLRKIENPFKRLQAQAEKNLQKCKDKIEAAKTYSSVEEAREMWGYDAITEDELHDIERFFEEARLHCQSDFIAGICGAYIGRVHLEIAERYSQLRV